MEMQEAGWDPLALAQGLSFYHPSVTACAPSPGCHYLVLLVSVVQQGTHVVNGVAVVACWVVSAPAETLHLGKQGQEAGMLSWLMMSLSQDLERLLGSQLRSACVAALGSAH
jgi:hypothetical protein